MGFRSHYVGSPRCFFLTEVYNEWISKDYHNTDDDERVIPKWF